MLGWQEEYSWNLDDNGPPTDRPNLVILRLMSIKHACQILPVIVLIMEYCLRKLLWLKTNYEYQESACHYSYWYHCLSKSLNNSEHCANKQYKSETMDIMKAWQWPQLDVSINLKMVFPALDGKHNYSNNLKHALWTYIHTNDDYYCVVDILVSYLIPLT